jgi:AAA15 family ATPase/GTPase
METTHYKSIKTSGFKRFGEFEMSNIGQFNLIVGDNNVGKTSLLEMLMIDEDARISMMHFQGVMEWRINLLALRFDFNFPNFNHVENIFDIVAKNDEVKYEVVYDNGSLKCKIKLKQVKSLDDKEIGALEKNIFLKSTSYKITGDELVFVFNYNDEKLDCILSNESTKVSAVPFIPSNTNSDDDLIGYYSKLVGDNIENKSKILEYLKIFNHDIIDIAISTTLIEGKNILGVFAKGVQQQIPLYNLGDGIKKYLRIILELYSRKNSYLLIDEVDNGIYYKKFEKYWTNILNIAKENNVQLFMTTHSKECIENYILALEELGSNFSAKSRLITLQEINKKVHSFVMNYDEFSSSFNAGNELRSL